MSEIERPRVVIDAASGDDGADTALAAASRALQDDASLELVLVGHRDLRERLARFGLSGHERVEVMAAEHVLAMDVGAAQALRRGQGSSMQLGLEQLAAGRAAAVVSAGNTGALMALSRQVLGMLPGIERPALMAALPSAGQAVWMLDLGANIGVNAQRLHEFAQLGSTAVRVVTRRAPRIGLLNIGREPGKGPDVLREAARLIEVDPQLDYAGFVEADRVFAADVDLVVCDGFAGNVLLKGAEGVARLIFHEMRRQTGLWRGFILKRPLRGLYDKLDPARHNGAPLLGVRGIVIKSHGGACERGFASAIRLAALEARRNLIPELEHALWTSY